MQHKLIAVLTLSLIIAAYPLTALCDQNDQVPEMIMSMPSRYSSALVEVRTDSELDASAIAKQIEQAYEFDRLLQGWQNQASLNRRVIVGLASEQTITRFMHSTMGGRAIGTEMFASHASVYREHPDFGWFVTAHELEHLEMHRLGAKEPEIPVYIFEGIACSVGDRYVASTIGACRYLINAKRALASCTAEDATDVVRNFRQSSAVAQFKQAGTLWKGEHIGGLFFEFLRMNLNQTAESFFRAFGELTLDVAHGKPFDRAFYQRFGITLEEAETRFVSFMRTTQGNPNLRFRGTVYEQIGI